MCTNMSVYPIRISTFSRQKQSLIVLYLLIFNEIVPFRCSINIIFEKIIIKSSDLLLIIHDFVSLRLT